VRNSTAQGGAISGTVGIQPLGRLGQAPRGNKAPQATRARSGGGIGLPKILHFSGSIPNRCGCPGVS
jgi:hypothetical protein